MSTRGAFLRWGVGTILLGGLVPGAVAGQVSEIVAEVGGSRIRPPVGVEGLAATFLVAGLRASRFAVGGSGVYAALLGGRALDAHTAGDFVSGEIGGEAWASLGGGWEAGGEVRGFGFDVGDPLPYRAGTVEGSLALRVTGASVSARLAAESGVGRSRVELRRYADGPAAVFTDDLWRFGGTVEVLAGSGSVAVGGGAGVHASAGGTYRSVGGRLVVGARGAGVEVRVDAWRTPVGTEATGGLAVVIPLGDAWSLRGFWGRSEPDPLTLAEPGSGGGGMLLGRRIAGSAPSALRRSKALHQVLGATAAGARVRFELRRPTAGSVEILGDFTRWEPVAMTRVDGLWIVELTVPAGTHHFGFLVDGIWFLPDDAPDAVADDWGRRNATLVVDPTDPEPGASPDPEGAAP